MALAKLSPGQAVCVQSKFGGLWELTGMIVEMRPDRLSYMMEINGRMYVRAALFNGLC